MAVILLSALSFVFSFAAVFVTAFFVEEKRSKNKNILYILTGFLICFGMSVLADAVIQGGKPAFYYHTHQPGKATLRIFAASCIFGSALTALLILFAERKLQRKTVFRWIVVSFLFAFCGSVILEIGWFNFRHFELIGTGAQRMQFDLPGAAVPYGFYFNRASWKYHPFYYTTDRSFEIYPGYEKVRNIFLDFDDGNPGTVVQIGFNDRTHRNYEYFPEHRLIQKIPRSFSIPLHTVGTTYSVSIRLPNLKNDEGDDYGISLPYIVLNQVVPLEIHPARVGLCFLCLFFLAAFFPGSPLWQLPLNLHNPFQIGTAAGLILLVFLAFFWTVFSSYTGSDEPFASQKAALNENYQQYNKLVDALMIPRYALLDMPHRYLEQFDDVYDMRQREEKTDYDYLWDTAYYEGRYYVYFGVVPAVTVLLPYKLITGEHLDLDYPILGFCCLFVLGLYGVYSQIVSRYFSNISFGLYCLGFVLLVTSVNLTWCLRRTLVYELAITSGICFAVWGVFFMLLAGRNGRLKLLWLFLSGSCTALAVGCRPTMLFVSLVVLTIALFDFKESGKMLTRQNLTALLVFVIPYAAAGLALMKYNIERFGNPFEFGITYQLTTENRAAGLPLLGFSGRTLSVISSLFTFPAIDLNFPFVHLQKPDLPYNGVILNSDMVLGVFAYPVMVLLFFIPFVWKDLKAGGQGLLLFCLACPVSAAGICITASAYAITNRYLTDYLFLLALPAVFTMFVVYERFEKAGFQKAVQTVILYCAGVSLILFIALSLTGEDNWFQMINPLYYDRLKYAFSPWL